ncbi:anti-sigma factor family protein [Paenibacillus hodogayensis]|uniref:Anti-sigma-W factor RsiW n=1 Tax=Paenibacillus hodogayensis TaxID=279208 RepID=A0ABV5W0H3_9BACL
MSKTPCDLIGDLLPLYADQVCSESSRSIVEDHLAECADCREQLKQIRDELNVPLPAVEQNRGESRMLQGLSAVWSRSVKKAYWKGAAIAGLLGAVIVGGYFGLVHWNVTTVSGDQVQITDVSRLADGRIVYHVKLTDGYALNEVRFDDDANGNLYLTPYRPVIKSKPITGTGLFNKYYWFNEQEPMGGKDITALYFGTRKNAVLVWKKGMSLPAASEKVEALLRD